MPKNNFVHVCLVLLPILTFTGCTHTQLQCNTIDQTRTTSDIYQQQVLDNLAMFVKNSSAVPQFSLLGDGSNDVSDSVNANADPLNAFRTALQLGGSRGMDQGWVVTPISDPHKLELMQCAYRRALGYVSNSCPNCKKLEAKFEGVDDAAYAPDCPVIGGFLQWSDRQCDVPKGCCGLHGEYCGCYVWVCPNPEARMRFSRLVFKILDYAVHESHGRTKTVTLNVKGIEQTAVVNIDATPEQIEAALGVAMVPNGPDDFSRNMREKVNEIRRGPDIRSYGPDYNSIRGLDRRLRTLGLDR